MRILVVEDERDLNKLICDRLLLEGYAVDSCFDGKEAIAFLEVRGYDGAIVDIMIPGANGYEVLHFLQEKRLRVPVMFLTALSETEEIVRGLDAGADDYLTKPFDFSVLMARIRAMTRKSVGVHENTYRCADLEIRERQQEVYRGGKRIELTSKEFSVLLYMMRNQNIVLSREQILSGVWNDDGGVSSNIVDVYIRYLRKKIDEPFDSKLLHTVRGVGYCLREETGKDA